MICASASITESVGVPVTENRRSSWRRSRTGVVRVSECPVPDCSSAGATIQISSLNRRATDFQQRQATRVHAVVIREQYPHASGYAGRRQLLQPRTVA